MHVNNRGEQSGSPAQVPLDKLFLHLVHSHPTPREWPPLYHPAQVLHLSTRCRSLSLSLRRENMSPSRQLLGLPRQPGDIELVFMSRSDVSMHQLNDNSNGNGTNAQDIIALTLVADGQPDGDGASDIYRGVNKREQRMPLDTADDISSTTSSSSSSSLNVVRRLGALAAVVEHAISRWARAQSDSVSSSSSSTSSTSSSSTRSALTSRRFGRRRRDTRASTISLQTTLTEQAIIARKKAREETRFVPRQFILLIPPSLISPGVRAKSHGDKGANNPHIERITNSSSLQEVTQLLESVLRSSARARKTQARFPEPSSSSWRIAGPSPQQRNGKGKSKGVDALVRENIPHTRTPPAGVSLADTVTANKGWWLDVASPTWEDMRTLGKVGYMSNFTRTMLSDTYSCSVSTH